MTEFFKKEDDYEDNDEVIMFCYLSKEIANTKKWYT